jgi:RNA polymerase sigma factor for flagellar operon FliA
MGRAIAESVFMTAAVGASLYQQVQSDSMSEVVVSHAPLVKRIAHHLLMRMPSSVQLDDLVQSGMIGLLEAARKYDVSKGASFETYAGIRIRGAMLDEIRRGDWAPRSVHRKSREVAEAVRTVESRTGTDAKDHEVAQVLGIDLESYYNILQDASGSRLFSFDDLTETGGDSVLEAVNEVVAGPSEELQDEAFRFHLAEAIEGLPEREKLVLSLYYDEELNLKEIGEVLGVSESRVSQIHSQAALRLRSRLQDWK